MFLRRCKHSRGSPYAYWKLVESHRTARGPRQRVVAYLGDLDEAGRAGVAKAADESVDDSPMLFDDGSIVPRHVEIDTHQIRVESLRGFGGEWLRSNVSDWTAEELWRAYMQLTEAENAFRIHKSDLSLRPIWHQKQERVQAHVLVCFLAYVLWKTLGQWCKQSGLGDEPRKVLDEIKQISLVDVILTTRCGQAIRKRCATQPAKLQKILLNCLRIALPRSLPTMADVVTKFA